MLNLTIFGFTDLSDYIISDISNKNDIEKIVNYGSENQIVFISIALLEKVLPLFEYLLLEKNIHFRFVLGWNDIQPSEILLERLDKCANKISCVNLTLQCIKYNIIPIGFRSDYEVKHSYIINEKLINREKEHLLFMCFSIITNIKERLPCWEYLIEKPFVHYEPRQRYNLEGIEGQRSCGITPIPIFMEHLHKSIFCVCPEGAGIDTHRFYESLYLDSIPIVKKGKLDKLYNQFPCVIIDNWDDITYEFLIDIKEEMYTKLQNFKKLRPNWFNEPEYFI